MTEHEAYVAFNLTDNIGSVGVGRLASKFGSVAAAWEAYPDKAARDGGDVDVAAELAKARSFGVRVLTPDDVEYPTRLKATSGHPLALYVKGSVAALSRPSIAIVGTRRATSYGRDQAYRLAADLTASGWMVISGLALGIDGEAHRGALEAGGITVGVLGSALDQFYPNDNRELARAMVKGGGAVVSEFPFGRPPDQQTFPQRNHVVAALSSGIVAVEAPMKSGALITTTIAADLGRTVMAVPSRVDNRMGAGCLQLLRDGARLVRNAADVNEEMGELVPRSSLPADYRPAMANPIPEPPPYTVEESLVMRNVDVEGVSIEKLAELTGLSASKLSTVCMSLRIKGRLRFLPGNRVSLPRTR